MRRFPSVRRALVAAVLATGLSALSMDPALAKTVPVAGHKTATCSHASHTTRPCASHGAKGRYWRGPWGWHWRR